jgi:hypothetical protein
MTRFRFSLAQVMGLISAKLRKEVESLRKAAQELKRSAKPKDSSGT